MLLLSFLGLGGDGVGRCLRGVDGGDVGCLGGLLLLLMARFDLNGDVWRGFQRVCLYLWPRWSQSLGWQKRRCSVISDEGEDE